MAAFVKTVPDLHHYSPAVPAERRPVVFIGPYEHHSKEMPWRESIADVVPIAEDGRGGIDLGHLKEELVWHTGRPPRIGSFSAASNVTGRTSDADAVSELLHRHGALAQPAGRQGHRGGLGNGRHHDVPDGDLVGYLREARAVLASGLDGRPRARRGVAGAARPPALVRAA